MIIFLSRKSIWKFILQKVSQFIQASFKVEATWQKRKCIRHSVGGPILI